MIYGVKRSGNIPEYVDQAELQSEGSWSARKECKECHFFPPEEVNNLLVTISHFCQSSYQYVIVRDLDTAPKEKGH